MNSADYVRVYRAANATEAHLLKGLLEQHGISVRIFGDGLSSGVGELPVDVIQVEIQVPEQHHKKARDLIEEYESHARDKDVREHDWICKNCGESNPAAFDVCWQCNREADI